MSGAKCNYPGISHCNYYPTGKCSPPDIFQCADGKWVLSPKAGLGPLQPCVQYQFSSTPHDGDTCECPVDCTLTKCETEGKVHAVCDNTTWHVTSEPCTDTPCGPNGLTCKARDVCVINDAIAEKYKCEHDRCLDEGQSTACDCGRELCGGGSFQCSVVKPEGVYCSCPTC